MASSISMLTLPLDTMTLQRLLSKTHGTHFLGVFALDQLPPRLPMDDDPNVHGYCMIVNTDPANLAGMHWLAVYIDRDKRQWGEVFDSYGRVPPLSLQRWLAKHCRHWTHTRRFIQGPLSTLCGVYCIYVLHLKCTTQQTFRAIVEKEFTDITTHNDAKMRKFLTMLA